MQRIRRVIPATIIGTLAMTGCSAQPIASELLSSATVNSTMDRRAAEECNSSLSGYPLLAAVDSTVSEVHHVGDQVKTIPGWDDALPAGAENYAAICIFDATDVRGIRGNPDLIACWVSQDSTTGGSGIITVWARTNERTSH